MKKSEGLKERKNRQQRVVMPETGVCGLLVKFLSVGAVYDTFLVGCAAVIHSG